MTMHEQQYSKNTVTQRGLKNPLCAITHYNKMTNLCLHQPRSCAGLFTPR